MPVSSTSSSIGAQPTSHNHSGNALRRPAATTTRSHVDLGAVGQSHAGRCAERPAAPGSATSPVTATPVRNSTRPFGQRGAAQHPFERRSATRQHRQLVVARFVLEADHGRRQVVAEPHLGGTFVDELLVDVGIVRLQQAHQAGQEGMAVPDLRRAATVPVERLVGRLRHRRVVALEHGHGVPSPGQRQRRAEPGNSSSDDRHFHRLTLIGTDSGAHHGRPSDESRAQRDAAIASHRGPAGRGAR